MTSTLAAKVALDVAEATEAPHDAQLAIEIRDLTMSYGDRHVLRGVDFEVCRGEVFCLLGPNGAGKTTTVEILEGFRQRTGGIVRVLGMDPAAQPARLRERIGIVLQECGFPRQARVAELIDIWRAYYPASRPLADLLAVVELTEDRNSQVRRLSGGQRRRLDLALALAGDPDLIFLDEPTTGFDPESRRRCWGAIENLRQLGKTIVLTTHYLDEAERLADRLAILQAGRIQVAGTVQQVARQAGVPTRITFTAPEQLRNGSVRLPSSLGGAVTGEVATCVTGHTATALRELLSWAAANDLGDLDDLSVENPTLEDAYMQLVCGGTQ
jgi:ABC-2 type transport system ATP-binding protein